MIEVRVSYPVVKVPARDKTPLGGFLYPRLFLFSSETDGDKETGPLDNNGPTACRAVCPSWLS